MFKVFRFQYLPVRTLNVVKREHSSSIYGTLEFSFRQDVGLLATVRALRPLIYWDLYVVRFRCPLNSTEILRFLFMETLFYSSVDLECESEGEYN